MNQQTILGFTGRQAEVTQLKNGTPVAKFSVATKISWKDKDTDDWKERTQWHNVVGYGETFAKLADRLVKGAYVLVQGEHLTRQYDKTIEISNGKKKIEHVIKATVVELKADIIKLLDRAAAPTDESATDQPTGDDVPF
jgi:single-strand DNA-binding protein